MRRTAASRARRRPLLHALNAAAAAEEESAASGCAQSCPNPNPGGRLILVVAARSPSGSAGRCISLALHLQSPGRNRTTSLIKNEGTISVCSDPGHAEAAPSGSEWRRMHDCMVIGGCRMQVGQEEARGRHGDAGPARHLGRQGAPKPAARARMRSGAGLPRHVCSFALQRRTVRCTEGACNPHQG